MNDVLKMARIAVSVILTMALAAIAIVMSAQAHRQENAHALNVAAAQKMYEQREWNKYLGRIKGTDVINFVLTHKYSYDVTIIAKTKLGTALNPCTLEISVHNAYRSGAKEDAEALDRLYSLSYLYYYGVNVSSTYIGELLYDNNSTDTTVGEAVTGILFTEVV